MDNIKMNPKEVEREGANLIYLPQDNEREE